ncbi:MAG: hypothetical protein RSF90_03170, partial [Pygmaiobacter sp.]
PRKKLALFTGGLLLFSILLGTGFAQNTVSAAVVGRTTQPAVILTRGGKAAVFWAGGAHSTYAVERYLWQTKAQEVVLWCDLSSKNSAMPNLDALAPDRICKVSDAVISGVTFEPFDGILCSVRRQGDGMLCLVDAGGYRVLIPVGKTDLSGYPPVDVCVAGSAMPRNLQAATVVTGETVPDWVAGCGSPVFPYPQPEIRLRTGKSIQVRKAVACDE